MTTADPGGGPVLEGATPNGTGVAAARRRLAALPAVTRYGVLLLTAEGVLGVLTFVGRLMTSTGPSTVVGMALFLPLPLALLGIAWLMLDRSRFAWRVAILYQVLLAVYAGLGLLSSFTALFGFILAVATLVLLLHSDTRVLFSGRSQIPPPLGWTPPSQADPPATVTPALEPGIAEMDVPLPLVRTEPPPD